MPKAFCPGHITCFFSPGDVDGNLSACGSTGLGIRLSAGAEVTVEETVSDRISVTIDGAPSDAPVTAEVLHEMLPGRGAEVTVTNGLPVGQGFGMSAAGAVAAALCAASLAGLEEDVAWDVAHRAEITGGGGRGDVDAIQCASHVPVRLKQGVQPHGKVECTGLRFPILTVAVLGPKMNTGRILSNPDSRRTIYEKGAEALRSFDGSAASLFRESNRFSEGAGLESPNVRKALGILRSGHRRAAMCMLGNSIFTDTPMKMVLDALPDAEVYSVMSTGESARLLRCRCRAPIAFRSNANADAGSYACCIRNVIWVRPKFPPTPKDSAGCCAVF